MWASNLNRIWLSMPLAVKSSSMMLCCSPRFSQVFLLPVRNQMRVKLMKLKVMKMAHARFHHLDLFSHGETLRQSL